MKSEENSVVSSNLVENPKQDNTDARNQNYCQICKNINITLLSLQANTQDPLLSFSLAKETSHTSPQHTPQSPTKCLSTQDQENWPNRTQSKMILAQKKIISLQNKFMCEQCISRIYHQIRDLPQKKYVPFSETPHEKEEIKKQTLKEILNCKNPHLPGSLSLLIERSRQVDIQESKVLQKLKSSRKDQCSILGLISNSSHQIYENIEAKSFNNCKENEIQKKVSDKGIFQLGLISNNGSDQVPQSEKQFYQESEVLEVCSISDVLTEDLYKNLLGKALIQEKKHPQINSFTKTFFSKNLIPAPLKSANEKMPKAEKKQGHLNFWKLKPSRIERVRRQKRKRMECTQSKFECDFCHEQKIVIIDEESIICIDCFVEKNVEGNKLGSGECGTISV